MAATKTIPGFPNYAVTDSGKVWSNYRNIWLKPQTYGGYDYVRLYVNRIAYNKTIHRLILETYVGICPKGLEACHNNGNRKDNRLNNLRWGTRLENQRDRFSHGTQVNNSGESNPNSKLTEQDVRMIIYMWRTGDFTQGEIASYYNIGNTQVCNIINKISWKRIWRN